MPARAALVIGVALALALAATHAPRPPSMSLRDRLAALAMTGCTTDAVCEMRAAELGIDPTYAAAPADALELECGQGDDAACRYLDADH